MTWVVCGLLVVIAYVGLVTFFLMRSYNRVTNVKPTAHDDIERIKEILERFP